MRRKYGSMHMPYTGTIFKIQTTVCYHECLHPKGIQRLLQYNLVFFRCGAQSKQVSVCCAGQMKCTPLKGLRFIVDHVWRVAPLCRYKKKQKTSGAETAYPSRVHELTPGFRVAQSLVFCVVSSRSLFGLCYFSLDCCVCPSIVGFCLPPWFFFSL